MISKLQISLIHSRYQE